MLSLLKQLGFWFILLLLFTAHERHHLLKIAESRVVQLGIRRALSGDG
jgi:hypothetical protein